MLRKLAPLASRITRGSKTALQQRRGMAGGERAGGTPLGSLAHYGMIPSNVKGLQAGLGNN